MVVSAAALIPVEEYLTQSYEPDCDYVDGVLEERNLGEYDHANLQTTLAAYLTSRRKAWRVRVCVELRVRVSARRVRVPDICILSADRPVEQVVTHPPMLCIEVLSPEDRWSRYERRIEDYLAMGVPAVWVFDPSDFSVFECTQSGRRVVSEETLQLAGAPISVTLAELKAELD